MSKLIGVAREEIRHHLSQWTFYITVLAMPLIFVALGALPRLGAAAQESPLASVETVFNMPETITVPTGYVDYAGLIRVVPEDQARHFRAFGGETAATEALKKGEIESYYVIAADYLQSGRVAQYSANPQLFVETDGAVSKLLRDNLLQLLPEPEVAARLDQPIRLTWRGPPAPMFNFIPPELEWSQLMAAGLVVGLFAYILNISGNLLLRSLQREVWAKVLEMLIASATPEQFIGGKLLGLAVLTLGQAGLALAAGAWVYAQNPDGAGPAALPLTALALSLPYLLLGYLAYCGGIMSLAAIWPNFPESALLLAMVRLLMFSPLLGAVLILPNAHGPAAVALTLCPPTAPLLMPLRLLLGPVPGWQWGSGLLILAIWAVFWVWLSARLFRIHSLLTGRTATPRVLWRALWG